MLPYVLLGDVARQIYDGVDGYTNHDLQVEKIEWGMFERNLTPEIKSLFLTWGFEPWEAEGTQKGFKYFYHGYGKELPDGTIQPIDVPIYVTVITKKWKFFNMPDMKYYGPDYFNLPNPFDSYWKSRYLVR